MTATTPTAPPVDEACQPSPADHAMGLDAATQVAGTLKALGDPLRLRMLSLIATSPSGEACVCDLATVAEVSQPTVSHHLKLLKDVGLLTSERRGTWVYYRVQPALRGAVTTLLDSFAPVAAEAAHLSPLTGLTDAETALARIADRLAAAFPDRDPAAVLTVVRESYTGLARSSAVRSHLVVNTERFARQRLTDAERAITAATAHRPQVLFVCVANAGRSQLAAALLHHYAGDQVVVRSAGSAPAGEVHPGVRPLLEELSADAEAFPKPLTDDAVRAADVVITMGCGDTCPILPGKRYEDWVVGDPALASDSGVRSIRDEIDRRVRALLADLLPDLPVPA
ncbi:metalloregulator ArsR/SmtB family transcription factor [Cellulomonas sp. ES6]|uniref:metalloregulator ArsR/SmtB family transcription factor n=1 Tax=Cellulomonas sp. ES6 TaxID=3039384 RepID=UPI0024B6C9A8|nr:metalloregulator ArsR/SmtB family transcription factor [Cellulomonas sp. ES6]WHP16548.1 metalloregulator ArsR/SmtB family transcription factor [Cellulomonas sp. ES6]